MSKRFMGWSLAAAVVAVSGSAALACEEAAKTADAKDAKDTKIVAAKSETTGCNMPCCAHDKGAAEAKAGTAVQAEPAIKAEVAANGEKPCAGHDGKGCAKKASATAAAVAAKAEPAKDAVKPEPAADPGTQR